MAYTISKTDGATLVSIPDGSVDTTTDLQLVGRNYAGYGLFQNENFVKLLENFANTTPPHSPIIGQLWYNKSSSASKLAVYDGAKFNNLLSDNGSGAYIITNGTAPTTSVVNSVQLYAEDVSSSSELKVRDEAGNVTVLSPHNFSLIPDGPSEPMAWSYYSEKNGTKINVDMLKLARLLEQLTGETLVYIEETK